MSGPPYRRGQQRMGSAEGEWASSKENGEIDGAYMALQSDLGFGFAGVRR